ncbi:MAG TPA: hypothetical protein VKO18_06895 [Terriglobia bacterium]|nr:hypothetical protein [Terriglobia bacterium]
MEASLPQLILPIKLERSSERLTSLGGLVVLEELARAVGLWEELDAYLKWRACRKRERHLRPGREVPQFTLMRLWGPARPKLSISTFRLVPLK